MENSPGQPKMPEVGPVGRNLIEAVKRLRRARGLTYKKLSAALEGTGRPIFPLGLSRLEKAQRRVDVDELVALAGVFDVTPARLLAPAGVVEAEDHPAVTAVRALADRLAELIAADDPEAASRARRRASLSLRRARFEAEELIDGEMS
jgi:transcriptional regulator with XRE-family HTH domain